MSVKRLRLALPAVVLAMVLSAAAEAYRDEMPAAGGLGEKLRYCTDCHGTSGQGYFGYLPVPRLAGQQADYIENQLRAFAEHRRESDILALSRVHALSAAMRSAVAHYFSTLNARPLGGGPAGLAETGRRLFEEGDPNANVPACAACHGPEATGHPGLRRLPRPGSDRTRSQCAPCGSAFSLHRETVVGIETRARR
jgi:cytochrome c553